jgi:hypothetical protein
MLLTYIKLTKDFVKKKIIFPDFDLGTSLSNPIFWPTKIAYLKRSGSSILFQE